MGSRRGHYVVKACKECKRRKVRCDGGRPCHRCMTQSAQCVYLRAGDEYPTPSPGRARGSARSRRQSASEVVSSPSSATRITADRPTPTPVSNLAQPSNDTALESPEFCGPSSSEYTLSVANRNLRAMGMPLAILDKSGAVDGETAPSPSRIGGSGPLTRLVAGDPLWKLGMGDALDLIDKWCDGVGSLYPVVERKELVAAAEDIFGVLGMAHRHGPKARKGHIAEALFSVETQKLKAILAIGRTLDQGGRNEQAHRLFQSVAEAVEGLIWNSDGIGGIQLLIFAAIYHYHLDEEVTSGRIIGLAARTCFEMGLHRQGTLENTFPNPGDRSVALRTFWSVYMFERRTSLGLGTPFLIQDSYVDPSLFVLPPTNPLVSSQLEWTKLAGETWKALNNYGEAEGTMKSNSLSHLSYLDYQTIQWTTHSQAVMFVRKSHLRNLLYRPVLQSSTRIRQNERQVVTAIDIAKEAIQTLSDLNRNTSIFQAQPVFFKHLLLTAFGNLLLAAVNASSRTWDRVRDEFDMALTLLSLLSARSSAIMRLWNRLRGLRDLQAKLSQEAPLSDGKEAPGAQPELFGDLSFDDLFSGFQNDLGDPGSVGLAHEQFLDPMIRNQVNSLMDVSVMGMGGGFSDFPFVG